ncbi:MAG: O-antigen translocase [Flavobacteriaceae bacterium]|nr:O-antigen translocase [Flavobacteriaceae bacterium]
MKSLFNNNLLLKISSLNAVSIGLKIITGIAIQRALAYFVGAQGLGLVGNFRDFVLALQNFAGLGLNDGVIKYVAEHKSNITQRNRSIRTALVLVFVASVVLGIGLWLSAGFWNGYLFQDQYDFKSLLQVLALVLPLYGMNVLLLAVINGMSKFKQVVIVQLLTNIAALVVTLLLLWFYGLKGAMLAVLLAPVLSFVFGALMVKKQLKQLKAIVMARFDMRVFSGLGAFMLMALLSALLMPAVRILIRDLIDVVDSAEAVGYWEAMYRIASLYLLFATSLLSLYVLPKLSENASAKAFRSTVSEFYKTILPFFGLGLLLLYFIQNQVVLLVYNESFLPMNTLFKWQLPADFIKVATMVIAFRLLAQKMLWHYIILEVFSVVLLYAASLFFVQKYGFEGAAMAYLLETLVHLLLVLLIFRKSLFSPNCYDDKNTS